MNQNQVIKDYTVGLTQEQIDKGEGDNPYYIFNGREGEINAGNPRKVTIEGQEYLETDIGLYDPLADRWDLNEKGEINVLKTNRVKITDKGTNNETIFSKAMTGRFKKEFEVLKDIIVKEDFLKGGGVALDNKGLPILDSNGEPITAEQLRDRRIAYSEQYATLVKNSSSENFNTWYDGLYNLETENKKKGNPSAPDFWNKLKNAFVKKEINEQDFESGVNIFRATYYFGPLEFYGE